MDLSEEQIDQYRECPEEYIVYPVCHGVLLLVLRGVGNMFVNLLVFRHLGPLTTRSRMVDLWDSFM
jgi:hypothetical protein